VTVRVWMVIVAAAGTVAVAGSAVAAVLEWPRVSLGTDDAALVRVVLPGFAGRVENVAVHSADGVAVPVQIRQGKLWPLGKLASGERLLAEVTVRRPGWAGWLVGHSERRTFSIETPTAHLLSRQLKVKAGAPVRVAYDAPVSLVAFGSARPRPFSGPRAVIPVGVVARGAHTAGAIEVTAAARSWERLPARVLVSWFSAQAYPQLIVEPQAGISVVPTQQLTLTFSGPVSAVLGARRPRVLPATPGRWQLLDAHTLTFRPSGFGFGLGKTVRVTLPRAVHLAGQPGAALTRTVQWRIPAGSVLRLQQVLAQLGYLPLNWQQSADPPHSSVRQELAAAVAPPRGQFSWRYPNTPAGLRAIWTYGQLNEITRGAIMTFEDTHDLPVDGLPGGALWSALIRDAIAGTRHEGYTYVYVHRNVPQSLNLWHNGRRILESPGNTGVPAAPTQLGTFAVFEHIPIGTMRGTNPDGSHYDDPGIQYISYFHGGDAIHAFNRASYGTPQSLGCVELPLDAAAKVWPYTPIGTLVTIEN
jgi:peptidoglycan hydrolase-like protein with peptidoglycan-binding domain